MLIASIVSSLVYRAKHLNGHTFDNLMPTFALISPLISIYGYKMTLQKFDFDVVFHMLVGLC